jgi:hypothetical protein
VIDADDYCRQIEAHLCRKNDGHLIRIVGPAFEQVSGWAREGIPLSVCRRRSSLRALLPERTAAPAGSD